MTHYSPLKKLFRRQKSLAGVGDLMDERERQRPHEMVVVAKPLYFTMSRRDFEQHGEAIGKLVAETEWSKAAESDLPEGVNLIRGSMPPQ